MRKHIGKLIVLGVTAAFIAVIALLANAASGTEPVQAGPNHTFHGWCVYPNNSGDLSFYHVESHDVGGSFPSLTRRQEFCEDEYDGGWVNTRSKNRLQSSAGPGTSTLTNRSDYPDGWFERPSGGECDVLPNSGAILGSSGSDLAAQNRLQHVYLLKTIELALQIVYDIGSNEVTGVTGAILGSILGVSKVATYVTEWNYEMQDECQEILERGQIADIHVDTEQIVADVKTILARVDVAVSTRATQTSVDALDAKVVLISTALASLATSLTTETDEIDIALAKLKVQLLSETDEIDAALAKLKVQLLAGLDQDLRLYIEDHLETCSPIVSLLLDEPAGLLPLTVLVVAGLADQAEAEGLGIGNARLHLGRANGSIAANEPRAAFQSLCIAYEQIVRGGPR